MSIFGNHQQRWNSRLNEAPILTTGPAHLCILLRRYRGGAGTGLSLAIQPKRVGLADTSWETTAVDQLASDVQLGCIARANSPFYLVVPQWVEQARRADDVVQPWLPRGYARRWQRARRGWRHRLFAHQEGAQRRGVHNRNHNEPCSSQRI